MRTILRKIAICLLTGFFLVGPSLDDLNGAGSEKLTGSSLGVSFSKFKL